MSSPLQHQYEVKPDQPAAPRSNSSEPAFPGKIFFMVNSLETGGSERQFVEVARCLKSNECSVQVACIQKKGSLLDTVARAGLGELHQFGLGGSLYGMKSMQSRWRLMRHLRK